MLFVLSTLYDYSSTLSCYCKNELQYKIELTKAIIKTRLIDKNIEISIYKINQNEEVYKECCFVITKDNEFLYVPYGSIYKGITFDDFYKKLIIYNNVKGGE